MAEKEKIRSFAERRIAFRRQIDNATTRGMIGANGALCEEIVRLAVEEYGVDAGVLPKGNPGETLEAIIENLAADRTPTLH